MKKIKERREPVDIEYPEGEMLPNGTMVVTLPTLDQYKKYWEENKSRFSFACRGNELTCGQEFLKPLQWVFGSSKAAVVETVTRWREFGIKCEFSIFRDKHPDLSDFFVNDQNVMKNEEISEGAWNEEKENIFQIRTNPLYGYWVLTNLPNDAEDDFYMCELDENNDPNANAEELEKFFQNAIFDQWTDFQEELTFLTKTEIDEDLEYWHGEKIKGEGYYGLENERGNEVLH